ncbi:hypothetical protein [Gallibacterium anatis]|uniref:hypothetical protein n=1 Tax=Gallibacterium anatis TaxID=750 RepID=UPI00300625B0
MIVIKQNTHNHNNYRNNHEKILTTLALAASLNVQAAPVMNFFELGIAQGQHAEFNQVGKHNIDTSIANEKGTLAMYAVQPSE